VSTTPDGGHDPPGYKPVLTFKRHVLLARDGAMARLVVQDSGLGIPADALPHVFDRFYRVDSARSRAQDGAGLGLTFVKWIAERHAGTVDVLSREGRGSTFTVSLPISLASRQEELC